METIDFILPLEALKQHHPVDHLGLQYKPLLRVWLLKLALMLGWDEEKQQEDDPFVSLYGVGLVHNAAFQELTGLPLANLAENSAKAGQLDTRRLHELLKSSLEACCRKPLEENLPLLQNIALLGRLLQLSKAEMALLLFAAVFDGFKRFSEAVHRQDQEGGKQLVAQVVARLSGQPVDDVVAALNVHGVLCSSGIITLDENGDMHRTVLIMEGLTEYLLEKRRGEDELMAFFFTNAPESSLRLSHFPHLKQDIDILRPLLQGSLDQQEAGVNILLYGEPGTGKTEFAKALAGQMDVVLYEVPTAEQDGEILSGEQRIRSFGVSQKLLQAHGRCLMLFDEMEDAFEDLQFDFHGNEHTRSVVTSKAWLNRMLETNPVPTLWITNSVRVDPAYLRRFDYSVRMGVPIESVRQSFVRHHFGTLNPDDRWVAKIAARTGITPAQFEKSARVAKLVSSQGQRDPLMVAERALKQSSRLLGNGHPAARAPQATAYDLNLVNPDRNLEDVIQGLARVGAGSLCLYGPPGTGKSAFGAHLAERLGKELLPRRASDLLSMWVGGTEKRIAAMFEEAADLNAVLLLDEADSFLADRRNAQRSWEVTQVNELLTQMEAFEGIFCCTTNLMQHLDAASLRRFLFKVKFDYLRLDQRLAMFRRELWSQGWRGELDEKVWASRLNREERLTPGDFAVVVKQARMREKPLTPDEFFEQLVQECEAKPGMKRPIGFIH